MSDYYIVSDVTLDLPQEIVDDLDLKIIPMDFHLGETTYTHYPDERELSCEKFYEALKTGVSSITSQINPVELSSFTTPFNHKNLFIYYHNFCFLWYNF